jgi:hypothetical protein
MAYTIIRFGNDYPAATGEVVGDVIGARWGTDALMYPYTLGGVTLGAGVDEFGGSAAIGTNTTVPWTSGDDLALRGRWRLTNSIAARTFRINLPAAGQYRVIVGCSATSYQRSRWRINDGVGGTNRLDYSWSSPVVFGDGDETLNQDQWVDQNGVARAIATNALTATPSVLTFSTGVLEFVLGGHAGGVFASDVSFIAFEPVAASGPTVSSISPTSGPVGTQVTFTGTNLGGTSLANVNGTAMTGILNDSATQVRATVGAGSTTGATGLTATGGSVTGGPTFTVTTPPPTRTGFRVVSGYPALGSIPINAVLTPPLVLQATAAGPVDTTDGDGTTVTIGIDIVLTGAEVVSGGTAVQSGGLVTFSSLVLRPVTSLLGTLAVPAAIGFATFAGLRIRFQ